MTLISTARQGLKHAMITSGLKAARLVRSTGAMSSARGLGAIFTLHHVRPKTERSFDPNAHLEITPEFLDATIRRLKDEGYAFLSLADLPEHMTAATPRQPVALFTLDDGYRNNAEFAQPVFSEHRVPYTVFVTGGFIDKTHTLWWETLAELLGAVNALEFDFGAGPVPIRTASQTEKTAAYDRIAGFIRRGDEAEATGQLNAVARAHGIDPDLIVERLIMRAPELQSLVLNPLATLGAHSISHRALSRLPEDEARDEIQRSAARIEEITGKRPSSIAYPYGDSAAVSPREMRLASELGFTSGVTTRPGTLSARTRNDPFSLPRISLNGHYQKPDYVAALASGIPFKLMGRR